MTKEMLAYLKANEYIHPESEDQETKGFLERQITAKNAYEFYYFLRKESDEYDSKPAKEKEPKKQKQAALKAAKEKKPAEPKKEIKKVSKTKTTAKKQVKK
jgi:hypothetical protein